MFRGRPTRHRQNDVGEELVRDRRTSTVVLPATSERQTAERQTRGRSINLSQRQLQQLSRRSPYGLGSHSL